MYMEEHRWGMTPPPKSEGVGAEGEICRDQGGVPEVELRIPNTEFAVW